MVFPRSKSAYSRYAEGDQAMGTTSPNKRRISDATRNMPSIDPPTKRMRTSGEFGEDPRSYNLHTDQYTDAKAQYLAGVDCGQQQGAQEQQRMLPKLSFQQYRMREQLRAYMEEELRRMRCDQKHRSCGCNYEACSKGSTDGA
ncbi:hypothetical protein Pmar_PMAR019841 [Perkinsus marinus ATCC 50983]|uniref:Uncharacterized protein n=1 Tax=Perkinsus marinus (strain ATCC 50983 / TXsc) TaxID=423536 RepID=C5KBS8_PERM5|nr:hypothetical protein Pmar_PMAR019841 [Perkinsus marinus ATCC 50983]EER17959.1 hypothetical protein Pmar_PMAR019841 [Perkinsus marinus ATCC 50983]|eukprot:XP_002786163.1 hypothetical protein Pmar_PMAR019841 [Perkinsus marinus ATCC 50983]